MNLIVAIFAFVVVLLGAYYVVYQITPAERAALIVEYTPDTSGARAVYDRGVESAKSFLGR